MEKPILFNTQMVQAILEGRKMQTRRMMKPQPKTIDIGPKNVKPFACWVDCSRWIKSPYQVGDILWVRETWTTTDNFINYTDVEIDKNLKYLFKCDDNGKEHVFIDVGVKKWKPSIHMPREAARTFLKVTDVRVDRIRATTAIDCKKEGIKLDYDITSIWNADGYIDEFKKLWDSIYEKHGFGWSENPWVWVIEFEKIEHS